MEGRPCHKCKRICIISDAYEHNCKHCDYTLCRACDDTTQHLNWYSDDDEPMVYLCSKCITKAKKKKLKAKKVANEIVEKNTFVNTSTQSVNTS
jgi:hypothetical protein